MKKRTKYIILAPIATLFLIGCIAIIYTYSVINTGFDIDKTAYIFIDKQKNYEDVVAQIESSAKIKRISSFKQVATILKYPENIKSGRYAIKPGMNVLEVVRMLDRGKQAPVQLKFNNIRTKEDLATRIADQLMISDSEILSKLNDSSLCESLGFNIENITAMFIPNTYEVYWDVSVDNFLSRMKKEYSTFWNEERNSKAKKVGLTPIEVSILASIVEEECYYKDEYPVVAGLYLNRIHKGMKLQADPTIKFAIKDFSLKRVLNKHKEAAKDSPYSTYANEGLPPGPIRISSIKGIDSTLSPDDNNYIFMCAKDDFSGRHNFAVTNAEHQRNADKYHRALNKRNIF